MKVCHRCGNQTDCYDIHISIREHAGYIFTQDFDLCFKCKNTLLDRLSVVISDCQAWKSPKEIKKTEAKTIKKKKKTIKK